jgi:hypothetical protein
VPTSSRSMRGGIVKSQFDLVSPVGECKASLAPLGPMSLDGLVACPDDGVATNGSALAIAGCVEHWAVPPDRPGSRHDMTTPGTEVALWRRGQRRLRRSNERSPSLQKLVS